MELEGAGFLLTDNDALTSLDDLAAVRAVTETLSVRYSESLLSIEGLHGVTAVGGDLKVTHNTALGDDAGQALLAAIGEENVAGEVSIKDNHPDEDTGSPPDSGAADSGK